jgi:hypothetical protein
MGLRWPVHLCSEMPMAGVRYCRWSWFVVSVGHPRPGPHRLACDTLAVTQRIFTGSASTASPPRIGWQPAGCLHIASRCKGSGTSHRTASSGGRSHSVPPMADHDALYRSLPRATGRMPRAAHRMRLGWGRAQLQTCLVWPLAAVVGASDGGAVNVGPEGREVASRRQRVLPLMATTVRPGPPKPRQAPPRVRPRFASPCPTRLWRRCAWARALRHRSSPSTRC